MEINITQPNTNNIATLTIAPDVGVYALVTMDGNMAGTYSVLVVPDTGWDDAAVLAAVLSWFSITQAS